VESDREMCVRESVENANKTPQQKDLHATYRAVHADVSAGQRVPRRIFGKQLVNVLLLVKMPRDFKLDVMICCPRSRHTV
jgi:hypothetical protein